MREAATLEVSERCKEDTEAAGECVPNETASKCGAPGTRRSAKRRIKVSRHRSVESKSALAVGDGSAETIGLSELGL